MKLSVRLSLLISTATLVPLIVLGGFMVNTAADLQRQQVSEAQHQTVDNLADALDIWLNGRFTLLASQASSFSVASLDAARRQGLVRLWYQQTPQATIVQLSDRAADRSDAAYLSGPSPNFPGRATISTERLNRFLEIVDALPKNAGFQVGAPYRPPGAGPDAPPVIPVTLPARGSDDIVSVELSLQELQRQLEERISPAAEITLLDAEGAIIYSSQPALILTRVFHQVSGGLRDVEYTTDDGIAVLAASAPVPRVGWTVIAAAPLEVVSVPIRRIRLQVSYVVAVAIVLVFVTGVMVARQISTPIVRLKDAAQQVGRGDLGQQVPLGSKNRDEIADLNRAFNDMSRSLAQNATKIEAQRAEIEAFNEELQQRVEERTRQLRQSQERLVRTARMAAVGELGAGLAHELNNPMTGILGMTQLLRVQQPEQAMLAAIEEQAQRCREILTHLRQFTAGSHEQPEAWTVIELGGILNGVLALVGSPLRQRGVEVNLTALPRMIVRGDRAALGRAFAALLTALRALYTEGGALDIAALSDPAQRRVGLSMTARGAKTLGGDDWMASGMGLWSARQILHLHGGALQEPRPDQLPLVWQLWLPDASREEGWDGP
ncbi:MAG: HAMP domain-containing protein [Myxococcota bacterium]